MLKGPGTESNLAKALAKAGDDLVMRKYLLDRRPKPQEPLKERAVPIILKSGKPDSERRHQDDDPAGGADSDFEDDEEIRRLQWNSRLVEMEEQKKQNERFSERSWGSLEEVAEQDFLSVVRDANFCVALFYHKEFERCLLLSRRLGEVAQLHEETRFVQIEAEKAPFFTAKLVVRVLPTVLVFEDGIIVDRIIGFEDIDAKCSLSALLRRLAKFGAIYGPDEKRRPRKAIRNTTLLQ
eukprot:TRINITY_DN8319_c0_g1_i2.p2 TRINITY_DN8319_c0_g1~~TRINITY_DN8319_c0_g1_i2.p2  ORF type:complete len:238 (-),score=72.01 TRINITY_DN8319_c0_g1_i2:935-1648(-)